MLNQFRLGVATRCFGQPLTTSIKSAAEMNVSGVQLDLRCELPARELTETGRRDFLNRMAEFGLSVSSTSFALKDSLYEPTKIDVRIAAIRAALTFAFSLRSTTLCIRVGQVPENAESKDWQLLVEVLRDLGRHANHVGTSLVISPTNDSAEKLKELMDEVKTGPIGIDFDPAHFAMTGRSVTDALRILHEFVMHVQLRDGQPGIDGGHESTVGQGSVDWCEVIALLAEIGYRGWLTAIRTQGSDRASDIARGVKFIQRMLIGG